MSSPNGSIANLVVARKSPRGAEEVRALRTQLPFAVPRPAYAIGLAARMQIKKAGAGKAPAPALGKFFLPRLAVRTVVSYFCKLA
jgi:hypothetical protein